MLSVRLYVGLVALLAWLVACAVPVGALGAPATKVLRYRGYRLAVPASWPVYRLDTDPTACVRFNRHAVYLGRPSVGQRCPAHAAGRTEAILIQPLRSRWSSVAGATARVLPVPSTAGAVPEDGSSAQLVNAAHGVVVTATWNQHAAIIERALDVRSLAALAAASRLPRPPASVAARASRAGPAARARVANVPSQPDQVYRGLGFDPCSTPSFSQMSAWSASPYRAVGVYIGGTNVACSQANLTANWVSQQSAAGWHLIPTYVGLQAPSNSCGCAAMSPGNAANQGAAAARDAVAQARAVGLGSGNPLYFDMEAYTPSAGNSSAVLAFLAAWTTQLHASGYKSGVYSSSNSGIRDLASRIGTGYHEPDDIWIANWNGVENTSDPNVPSSAWPSQRLHQFNGGQNETYRGVTINIDGDYLNGATAAVASFAPALASAPTLSVSPAPDGTIDLYPSWGAATGVSSWQVIAGTTPTALSPPGNPVGASASTGGVAPTSLTPAGNPISASTGTAIVAHSAFSYFAVRALGAAGQTLGSSAPVATPSHVAIFGQRVFVPRHGIADLPVGCFRPVPCHVTTTISAGRRTLARTGPELIPVGGGLAYFNLSRAAHAMLGQASPHQLVVKITVRAVSGVSATRQLNLIQFSTSGSGPPRIVTQSPALKIIGTTDFLSQGWSGGTLAACFATAPCQASTTISTAGGEIIARATPQFLGVNELGYLSFTLTAAGHQMLTHAQGNQLPATVTITTGNSTATAQIALVSFS